MRAKRTSSSAVFYPVTDEMGEHEIQRLIMELLRPMLARFLAERGVVAHVGADQFIYWELGNVKKRVAPDIYVLPNVSQDIVIPCWKTWESGIAPSFALEVAGLRFSKDYEESPPLYNELGVEELVIFDPHARPGSRSRRVRWQVYRRSSRSGQLAAVVVTQSDRVNSKVLDAWLCALPIGEAVLVRLGLGPNGEDLYPTEAEAERADRIRAEAKLERLEALLKTRRATPGRSRTTRSK